jgi:pantothenate kinase
LGGKQKTVCSENHVKNINSISANVEVDNVKYVLLLLTKQILPAELGPEVYSASSRNEYQKHKNNNVSGE